MGGMEISMKNVESKQPQEKLSSIITWVFAALIVIACFLTFLFHYHMAYDTGGFFVSGRMIVCLYYFIILIVAILIAVLLKLFMKKKLQLRIVMLLATLLPIVCFLLNYHTLKKDGLFYSLVDDGGIFHFIVIDDYDFDGMNDQEHRRLYEERVVSMSCSDTFFRDEIKTVSMNTTGIGAGLNGYFCKLDGENRIITLHLEKTSVEINEIELEIELTGAKPGESFSLYLQTDSDEVPVRHIVNDKGNISVVFDADTCLEWLKNSEKEYFQMMLRYEFN